MKTVLFLSIILYCVQCLGNPIRSAVGARLQGIASHDIPSYTPADYIQDGLISIWDGEWNGGVEVHEDAPAIWGDLTGTYPISLQKGVVFGDNYATTDSSFASSFWGISGTRIEFLTIEVAFQTESTAQQYIQMDLYRRSSVGVWDTYIGVGYWRAVSYGRTTVGERISISVFYPTASDNIPTYAYVNGDSLALVNVNFTKPYSMSWTIGGTSYGNPFVGKIFCIRLYDRELTEAERRHNLAVDEGRFGL